MQPVEATVIEAEPQHQALAAGVPGDDEGPEPGCEPGPDKYGVEG
jgi:hypothetical protein